MISPHCLRQGVAFSVLGTCGPRLQLLLVVLVHFMLTPALPAWSQDPDIEANEAEAVQEYFRTSELPDESPTGRGGPKRVSAPAGAVRLGCICMDDTKSATRSSGACSGHGGVRYWLYRTKEGDTMRVITGRHERHPHPLDSIERSILIQPEERSAARLKNTMAPVVIIQQAPGAYLSTQTEHLSTYADNPWAMGWPHVAALALACTAVVLMVRMLLVWFAQNIPFRNHALHDLLRSGKQPTEGENRENFD